MIRIGDRIKVYFDRSGETCTEAEAYKYEEVSVLGKYDDDEYKEFLVSSSKGFELTSETMADADDVRYEYTKDRSLFGTSVMWVSDEHCSEIRSSIKSAGCTCKRCGEFSPMSEPNQEDGSFKCWSCRTYTYR